MKLLSNVGCSVPVSSKYTVCFAGTCWRELAKAGWDVLALDLEGYGNSSRPAIVYVPSTFPDEPTPISPAVTVANVAAVVDYIRELRDVK